MIADLKPYPVYKPSGFAWFDAVPRSWDVRRAKNLFYERVQKGFPHEPHLAATQTMGVVRKDRFGERTVIVTKDFHLLKLVEKGDFVISLRSFQGGIEVCHDRGIISPAYTILMPIDAQHRKYFRHFFKSKPFVDGLTLYVTGIRQGQNIDYERLSRDYLPVPPPDEQELIVRFLDWASVRLGKAIAAKRKVIGLLEEQKQAIIHRAVTCGLDDSVPLKPSGLDWLGNVPEHWELRRLKTLLKRIDQGVSPLASNYLADANSWGVLKSGCVNGGTFRQLQHKRLDRDFVIPKSLAVMIGDVLISRACGSVKYVGSVGRVRSLDYFLILSDKTFRPVFRESVSIEFIVRAMNSRYYRRQVEQSLSGADGLANNLPLTDLKTFWFAIPPLHEANQIAEILDSSLSQSETTIRNLAREIQLLQEYRTRLIADVVTGKLDVRDFARTLPADIAEEAAELASSELGDDELSESDDELADELAGEPA